MTIKERARICGYIAELAQRATELGKPDDFIEAEIRYMVEELQEYCWLAQEETAAGPGEPGSYLGANANANRSGAPSMANGEPLWMSQSHDSSEVFAT